MKNFTLLSATCIVSLLTLLASCERTSKSVNKPDYLADAENLARQTQGFYSHVAMVDLEEGMENEQHKLTLTVSDEKLPSKTVVIYVEDERWKDIEISAGKYELLFLREALILNDPSTGERHEFVVKNENFDQMLKKLPKNYLSSKAIRSIGIATYPGRI